MPTLVISAPSWRKDAKPFGEVFRSLLGEGYALAKTELAAISPGCPLILLDKDKKRRAEGRVAQLQPTGIFTGGHMQRYNVHLAHLSEVPYGDSSSIRLNRRGVAIVD